MQGLCEDDPASIGAYVNGLRPVPLDGETPVLADHVGVLTVTDSHSVNKLSNKYIEANLDADVWFLAFLCKQHMTGTSVEKAAGFLELLPKTCTFEAAFFDADWATKFLSEVRETFKRHLKVVDPTVETPPACTPQDDAFARELLMSCYVRNGLRSVAAGVDAAIATMEKFLKFFRPPWIRKAVHVCPPGCCPDDDARWDKAYELYVEVIYLTIRRIAENKWTTADPVVRRLLLHLSFAGITRRSLQRLMKVPETDNVLDIDPMVLAMQGMHTAGVHKAIATSQKQKVLALVQEPGLDWDFFTWVSICTPVMRMHYSLFRDATWLSHKPDRQPTASGELNTASGEQLSQAIHLSNFVHFDLEHKDNPATRVLKTLSEILADPDGSGKQHITLLLGRFGAHGTWPAYRLGRVRRTGQRVLCYFWRHVWRELARSPWKWAKLFDPDVKEEAKNKLIDELCAVKCKHCLDKCFGRKLQTTAASGQCLENGFQMFGRVMFTSAPITSTFVERLFAWMTKMLDDTPQGLVHLDARHILNQFSLATDRWRELRKVGKDSNLERPPWAQTAPVGTHLTGFDLFKRNGRRPGEGLQGYLTAWEALTQDERDKYKRTAHVLRTLPDDSPLDKFLERAQTNAEVGGPWDMAALSGTWPIAESFLADLTGKPHGVANADVAFKKASYTCFSSRLQASVFSNPGMI